MAAQLILDDSLQSYSRNELRFLVLLARRLPGELTLRCCHEAKPPAPLNIAVDLGVVAQVTVRGAGADATNAVLNQVKGFEQMLTVKASRALEEVPRLFLSGGEGSRRDPADCPKCGGKKTLMPYKAGKRKAPGWACGKCGHGTEHRPLRDPAREVREVDQVLEETFGEV